MKMYLGNVPIKSMNVKHYEMSTQDATVVPSDLQAGVTCYARGAKVTGTGKCFSFATYGTFSSKEIIPIPVSEINTIIITSASYPVKMSSTILVIRSYDYTSAQQIATVTVDGSDYPITIMIENNMITIACDKKITLEVLFGKDEYTT